VDEAGNGICLPNNENANTAAMKHRANGMHGTRYNQSVLDKCRNAEINGGSDPASREQL
jgi:hypothetical protein